MSDRKGYTPSATDDLETIVSLCGCGIDSAESLANDLDEVKSLALQALKKLGD